MSASARILWQMPAVFAAGAAVLAYEILGARLLSPVFGGTLPVWSSVFAVTLVSLALGYAAGGAATRRVPAETLLAVSLAAAGLFICAVPWIRYGLLLSAMRWGVLQGALGSAAVLIGPPLVMLGAAGPLVLRMRAGDAKRVGRDTGRLSAVSTAGSVAGALAAGYWLVPRVEALALVSWLGAAVCALSGFVWVFAHRGRTRVAGAAVMLLAAVSAPWLHARRDTGTYGKVRDSAESFYGTLRVHDHDAWGKRVLYIDGVSNTIVDLKTLDTISDYVTGMELAVFFRPEGAMKRALLLGLGGGSLVGRLDRHYGIVTDAVEIDPAVVRLAKKWFAFRETGEMRVEDARTFLASGDSRYDVVFGDAFSGDRHPSHLFTVEAFRAVEKRLSDEGVFVVNVIGYALGERALMKRAVARTLGEVFRNVRVFPANQGAEVIRDPVNLIFFASNGPLEFARDPLRGRPEVNGFYRSMRGHWLETEAEAGELITDARNPVDRLNSGVFVDVRSRIFENRGRLLLD
jgi:spermidine synthase